MHELGIAQGILDLIRQHVPAGEAGRVASVRVRIGAFSGVCPESLAFCFEAIAADGPFPSARLEIERVPAACACEGCGGVFEPEGLAFACPACGAARARLASGTELQVVDIGLLDPEPVTP